MVEKSWTSYHDETTMIEPKPKPPTEGVFRNTAIEEWAVLARTGNDAAIPEAQMSSSPVFLRRHGKRNIDVR